MTVEKRGIRRIQMKTRYTKSHLLLKETCGQRMSQSWDKFDLFLVEATWTLQCNAKWSFSTARALRITGRTFESTDYHRRLQNFYCVLSGVGPKNLHFWWVLRVT